MDNEHNENEENHIGSNFNSNEKADNEKNIKNIECTENYNVVSNEAIHDNKLKVEVNKRIHKRDETKEVTIATSKNIIIETNDADNMEKDSDVRSSNFCHKNESCSSVDSNNKLTNLSDDIDEVNIKEVNTDEDNNNISNVSYEHDVATEMDICIAFFKNWHISKQLYFMESALKHMTPYQHSRIHEFLSKRSKRDIVGLLSCQGFLHVAERILLNLDGKTLFAAEKVCSMWRDLIISEGIWRKLIQKMVLTNKIWFRLSQRLGWGKFTFLPRQRPCKEDHAFFRDLYFKIQWDAVRFENNWLCGRYSVNKLDCRSGHTRGIYCLQFDEQKLIFGSRDRKVKVWDRENEIITKELIGHRGSILCLQYDCELIITGSSDSSIRIWDINSGELLNILQDHTEPVLCLKFDNELLVSSSKDCTAIVWRIERPYVVRILKVLIGHRAAINSIDFDHKYIITASSDKTLKIWSAQEYSFLRTLEGHKGAISCLHYYNNLIASGSADSNIMIWETITFTCIRILTDHSAIVRCIRMNNDYLVSGSYDGKIRVWDLRIIKDASKVTPLCIQVMREHTNRVLCIRLDDFTIATSSQDDHITFWDFLNAPINESYFG